MSEKWEKVGKIIKKTVTSAEEIYDKTLEIVDEARENRQARKNSKAYQQQQAERQKQRQAQFEAEYKAREEAYQAEYANAEAEREQQFKAQAEKWRQKQTAEGRVNRQMKMHCPYCHEVHPVTDSEFLKCQKCDHHLGGETYQPEYSRAIPEPSDEKSKKAVKIASVIVFASSVATATHYLDDYLYYRYPTAFEYNIISQCSHNSRWESNSRDINKRIQRCTCALEKTMREVSYTEVNENASQFASIFKQHLENQCR